jgi:hypothetical protein
MKHGQRLHGDDLAAQIVIAKPGRQEDPVESLDGVWDELRIRCGT